MMHLLVICYLLFFYLQRVMRIILVICYFVILLFTEGHEDNPCYFFIILFAEEHEDNSSDAPSC